MSFVTEDQKIVSRALGFLFSHECMILNTVQYYERKKDIYVKPPTEVFEIKFKFCRQNIDIVQCT